MKVRILTALMILLVFGLEAQLTLTLSESVEFALKNNKGLLKAQQEVQKYRQENYRDWD